MKLNNGLIIRVHQKEEIKIIIIYTFSKSRIGFFQQILAKYMNFDFIIYENIFNVDKTYDIR